MPGTSHAGSTSSQAPAQRRELGEATSLAAARSQKSPAPLMEQAPSAGAGISELADGAAKRGLAPPPASGTAKRRHGPRETRSDPARPPRRPTPPFGESEARIRQARA